MENRVSNFFKALLPTIFIFAIQMFVSMGMSFVVFCVKIHEYESGGFVDFMKDVIETMLSSDFNLMMLLVYVVISLILLGIWYQKVFGQEQKGKWKLSAMTNKPLQYVVGVVAVAFGAQYLCIYAMSLMAMAFPDWLAYYQNLMESIGLADQVTIPLVLYVVIFGPICEEIAYRGLTLGFAKRFTNTFWAANIIQAVLFAGLHMNPLQSAYAFFIGLLFGYFVHKTGSLLMGIILHMAFNATGVLGDALIVSGSNQMQSAMILFGAMVATYVGIVLIKRNIPSH